MSIEPLPTPIAARERAVQAAEAAAPLITDEPLPREASTLANIEPTFWDQYAKKREGGFRLTYVHRSDAREQSAYTEDIARGRIEVWPDGETRASMAATAAEKKAIETAAMASADNRWNAQQQAATARAKAIADAQQKVRDAQSHLAAAGRL